MTGAGHRATGIGAAFIAAAIAKMTGLPELSAAIVAAVSCTLPDWIELPIYRGGLRVGSIIPHRTITHWPALWLGVIAWAVEGPGGLMASVALGASVGALTHILGDAPNPMGIPWLLPHRRIRWGKRGLWRSGQHEGLIVLGYAALGALLWRLSGGWRPGDSFWGVVADWVPSLGA